MIKQTSLKFDLPSVSVVARLWVTGKGCRYFHSANLSEQECRVLFDELASIQTVQSEDVTEPIFGQVRGRRNAFYVVQRVPDPNNPERNVTNSWYFLDKSGTLTLPMWATFAENPVIADTQSEFVNRLKTTDFSPKPESSDSTESSTVEESGVSRPQRLHNRLKTLGAIGILGTVLLTIFIYFISTPSETPVAERPESESVGTSKFYDTRWVSEKVKEQMRETVRVRSDSLGDREVNNLDGDELLQQFLNLFVFDVAMLNLSASEKRDMEQQLEATTPNPFAMFLLGLPDNQEKIDKRLEKSMAELYRDRLTQLASSLCFDQSGNTQGLKSLNPEEIVIELRNRLDYREYYDTWHRQFQPNQKKDLWLDHWEVEGDKAWLPRVREFIKKNY